MSIVASNFEFLFIHFFADTSWWYTFTRNQKEVPGRFPSPCQCFDVSPHLCHKPSQTQGTPAR